MTIYTVYFTPSGGTAEFSASCFIDNIKTLKNPVKKLVVDSTTEIGNCNTDLFIRLYRGYFYLAAGWAIFDGIIQQINNSLYKQWYINISDNIIGAF